MEDESYGSDRTWIWVKGDQDRDGSCHLCDNEIFDFFALGVLGESLGFLAVLLIGDEELLDERGDVGEGNTFIDFPGDGLGVVDSAAEDDIVAFDFLAVIEFDGSAHEADVADVVLGAGVVAAGEMDVDLSLIHI